MMRKIHHVGVAVKDLDQAIALYKTLMNVGDVHVEEVPEQKVKVAMFPVGESRIELVAPTSPDSPVARYIEKKGEGIHHICFGVDDVAAELARLAEAGAALIDKTPRDGAHGTKVAFVHPKSTNGVLLELAQEGKEH